MHTHPKELKVNINIKIGAISAVAFCILTSSILPSYAQTKRFDNRHPRRAEVLHRDANLNRRINANKGDLGGHYGQLKHEDQSIHRQERRDKRNDGGHITKGEQAKLNHEENHVNNQIKRDQ
jgi:hypothetical protein